MPAASSLTGSSSPGTSPRSGTNDRGDASKRRDPPWGEASWARPICSNDTGRPVTRAKEDTDTCRADRLRKRDGHRTPALDVSGHASPAEWIHLLPNRYLYILYIVRSGSKDYNIDFVLFS